MILPCIILAIVYLIYFTVGKKIKVTDSFKKAMFLTHFLLLFIALILFFLGQNNIFLFAFWTDKIINSLLLFSIFGLIMMRRSLIKVLEYRYVTVLFYSPLLLLFSWIIPMFGAFLCYTFSMLFYYDSSKEVYCDKNYILKFDDGFLIVNEIPTLFIRRGFFIKKTQKINLENWNYTPNLIFKKIDKNSIKIHFLNEKNKQIDTLIKIK